MFNDLRIGATVCPRQSKFQVDKEPLITTSPTPCFCDPSPSHTPVLPRSLRTGSWTKSRRDSGGVAEGRRTRLALESAGMWELTGEKSEVNSPPAGHQNIATLSSVCWTSFLEFLWTNLQNICVEREGIRSRSRMWEPIHIKHLVAWLTFQADGRWFSGNRLPVLPPAS